MEDALRQHIGKLFHERWERLGFEGLLPEECDHVLLWSLHAECTSGGLDQFFCNSAGDHAAETLAALERHQMSQTANVLKLAMELLPGGWCAERDERCRRLDLVREADLSALDVEYEASIASMPADDSLGEAILLAYRREGIVAEQSGGPKPLGGPG